VLHFDCLDSTNSYAARLAGDPGNEGLVILADAQTAGRGQHGRQWQCPPGEGILLSALLFPPTELRRPVLLAAWAAVAVCNVIVRATQREPRIKWPNDVFLEGRKVCGILIEQGRGTVAGIGLNVNQSAAVFAAAGLPEAGSLASVTRRVFDVAALARELMHELDATYAQLCDRDLAAVESVWQRRLGLLGQAVVIECRDTSHRGRLNAVSLERVELQTTDGTLRELQPECVRHISAL
jgi:BirA family biotin operon repressor/biotin-[acetyl-CoA-carboxylase] ligase